MNFAKKSLGQNFLVDKNIIKKIVNLSEIENKHVIEIGPGKGALTDEILKKKPKTLTIIEKDFELVKILKKKYSTNNEINIFHNDILKFNLEKITKNKTIIFGNLPYNISSQILVKLIKYNIWPPKFFDLIFMFQKELGEKIIAKFPSKNYGRLSILSNYRLNVLNKFLVSPNCFRPIPKVNSSVLTFVKKEKFLLKEVEIDKYINFKRKLFSHKRKTLKNLLKNYNLKGDFDLNLRAEKLTLPLLIDIFREINV